LWNVRTQTKLVLMSHDWFIKLGHNKIYSLLLVSIWLFLFWFLVGIRLLVSIWLWLFLFDMRTNLFSLIAYCSLSILGTELLTTYKLILGTDLVTRRTLNTLSPMLSLDTTWFKVLGLSTEVNHFVITTELKYCKHFEINTYLSVLVLFTDTSLLLDLAQSIAFPLGTESNLLLGNTELAINNLDTLSIISLLLTKLDVLVFDTSLLLNDLSANLVTLLVTDSTVINISPSLVVLGSVLLPIFFTSTNMFELWTVDIQFVLLTSLLMEVLDSWNVNVLGTDMWLGIFSTQEVVVILLARIILSLCSTNFLPAMFHTILFSIMFGTDLFVTMSQTNILWLGILVALAEILVFETFAFSYKIPLATFLLGSCPLIVWTLSFNCLVVCTLGVAVLLMISITVYCLAFFCGKYHAGNAQ